MLYSSNGLCIRIVSSRSGLVESKATGQPTNSSMRRTYLIAAAGSCAHERARAVARANRYQRRPAIAAAQHVKPQSQRAAAQHMRGAGQKSVTPTRKVETRGDRHAFRVERSRRQISCCS